MTRTGDGTGSQGWEAASGVTHLLEHHPGVVRLPGYGQRRRTVSHAGRYRPGLLTEGPASQ